MSQMHLRRVRTNLGRDLRIRVKPKDWYPNRAARRKAGYVRGKGRPGAGDTIIFVESD